MSIKLSLESYVCHRATFFLCLLLSLFIMASIGCGPRVGQMGSDGDRFTGKGHEWVQVTSRTKLYRVDGRYLFAQYDVANSQYGRPAYLRFILDNNKRVNLRARSNIVSVSAGTVGVANSWAVEYPVSIADLESIAGARVVEARIDYENIKGAPSKLRQENIAAIREFIRP